MMNFFVKKLHRDVSVHALFALIKTYLLKEEQRDPPGIETNPKPRTYKGAEPANCLVVYLVATNSMFAYEQAAGVFIS